MLSGPDAQFTCTPRLTRFSWFHSWPRLMLAFWKVKLVSTPISVGSLPIMMLTLSLGTSFTKACGMKPKVFFVLSVALV